MRTRVLAACAAVALAVGCGGSVPPPREATPEDERAAEERIKEQAAQEAKAREQYKKGSADPANKD